MVYIHHALHDSATRQGVGERDDSEHHATLRAEQHMDASRGGQAEQLPRLHLQVSHPERLP